MKPDPVPAEIQMLYRTARVFPEEAAPFIKEVGRGAKGARDLTGAQAREAAALILDGVATPAQAAALFQAFRIKSETGEELAGMIEAVRERCLTAPGGPHTGRIEIGIPYDGRLRAFHVLPFAAMAARRAGLRIFFHGDAGVGPKFGINAVEILHALGFGSDASFEDAMERLERDGLAFSLQEHYSPRLHRLRALRDEVVLRGPMATVEKMLNLSSAATLLAGNFHTPYADIMAGAFARLIPGWGTREAWVVQGPEGHIDPDPRRRMSARVVRPGGIETITLEPVPGESAERAAMVPPDPPEVNPRDPRERCRWIGANLRWGLDVLAGREARGRESLISATALLLLASGLEKDFASARRRAGQLSRPETG